MRYISLLVALTLAGCASSGIVKLSPDTYMLSKRSMHSMPTLKAEVIREANAFAAEQGKIAIPLSTSETPAPLGSGQLTAFEYQFRVVDRNDPEARRTALVPRADVVVETEEAPAGGHQSSHIEKQDLYTELLKLDDLRKRGLITDEEFERQKQLLLDKQ